MILPKIRKEGAHLPPAPEYQQAVDRERLAMSERADHCVRGSSRGIRLGRVLARSPVNHRGGHSRAMGPQVLLIHCRSRYRTRDDRVRQ